MSVSRCQRRRTSARRASVQATPMLSSFLSQDETFFVESTCLADSPCSSMTLARWFCIQSISSDPLPRDSVLVLLRAVSVPQHTFLSYGQVVPAELVTAPPLFRSRIVDTTLNHLPALCLATIVISQQESNIYSRMQCFPIGWCRFFLAPG